MDFSKLRLVFCIPVALLLGCAVPVQQIKLPQPITLSTGPDFVLENNTQCSVGTGYGRVLHAGTHWRKVGSIGQGDVYRSPDQTLTVEGYNVREAYIVVSKVTLVGFYLPVEKTFAPASKRVELSIIKSEDIQK